MMGKRSLVTGGSVAANSLAWWLSEGGYEVTVVEREAQLVVGGQSVDLRGDGREVLTRMGLEETVRRNGTGETGWTYVDDEGHQIAAFEGADVGAAWETPRVLEGFGKQTTSTSRCFGK